MEFRSACRPLWRFLGSVIVLAIGKFRLGLGKACGRPPVDPAHATVPNSAPTPAVSAMASGPQNVTRIAPTVTPAPPARAANPPRSLPFKQRVDHSKKPHAQTEFCCLGFRSAPDVRLTTEGWVRCFFTRSAPAVSGYGSG